MSEQIQNELKMLYVQMEELRPYLDKAEKTKKEIQKLKEKCKHPEAYVYGHNRDEYEGRSYDEIRCEHCGEIWEERSGYHSYLSTSPKKMIDELVKFEEKYQTKIEELLKKIGKNQNLVDMQERQAYQFVLFYLNKGCSLPEIREKINTKNQNRLAEAKNKK